MQMMAPPHNMKAEQALIGSIINDNSIIDDLKVKHTDFYRNANQLVFECILELNTEKKKIDVITLQDKLGNAFEEVGGNMYLHNCTSEGIIVGNFKHWETIVIEKSMLRQQITIAQEIIDLAYAGEDASSIFKRIDDVDNYFDDELVMIKDFIHETMEDMEKYQNREIDPGIMTKIKGLDHLANGLVDGDLIYVGARPSMGKSALAMQMMLNIAEQGKAVAFFSLEMQNKKLAKRMLVNQANVHLNIIKDRKVGTSEQKRLTDAASKLFNQNIAISDNGSQTVSAILRKAKRHKKRHGLDVLIIDHFHLLKADGKFNSIYERRSHDSQVLKEMAKDLDVPVICLCQLSRSLESRPISDRLPILSDLKETGSLEQDGDLILFINREDYWHKNDPDYTQDRKATVSVAKNRDGEIGIFEMNWHNGTQRFDNI